MYCLSNMCAVFLPYFYGLLIYCCQTTHCDGLSPITPYKTSFVIQNCIPAKVPVALKKFQSSVL